MNRRKVDVPVIASIAIEVMAFKQVLRLEEESACLAASVLFLQQCRKSPRHTRVLTPSCRPVSPVPVIWAGLPLHFNVPHNRHAPVLVQRRPISIPEVPAVAWRGIPIAMDHPTPTLARMPEKRPSSELLIESMVEQLEGRRAHYRPIVIGPASDHRVEHPNQVRLLGCLVLADQLREPRPVAFDCRFAWRDEGFEAASPRRVVLARRVLANLEAKKVKACFALACVERRGDAGLVLTQFQADALQPFLHQMATVLDHASVPVEHDQIIGISDDLRLPMELTAGLVRVPSRPGWESAPDVCFESVQGDVGQQRRQYTPNKVANILVEFSTSIPRTQLRPRYGDGFLGAPLPVSTRHDHPRQPGQGDDCDPSRTPSPPTTGDSYHV
jgi:hypothetical protein